MHTERTGQGWKLLIATLAGLTIAFIVLVAVGASQPRVRESTDRAQILRVQAGDPEGAPADESAPNILKDFELVPGTAVLVDEHHVLAVYQNPQKEFFALVLFSVDCDRTRCTPTELLAFSIVDAEGKDVQLTNKPAPKRPSIGVSI